MGAIIGTGKRGCRWFIGASQPTADAGKQIPGGGGWITGRLAIFFLFSRSNRGLRRFGKAHMATGKSRNEKRAWRARFCSARSSHLTAAIVDLDSQERHRVSNGQRSTGQRTIQDVPCLGRRPQRARSSEGSSSPALSEARAGRFLAVACTAPANLDNRDKSGRDSTRQM